jgi:protein-S-isoprenylcysteine O-methyltransferase Ste14
MPVPVELSNVNSGALLLGTVLVLYLYFTPALVAFLRGHNRFWLLLGLNAVLPIVQFYAVMTFFPIPVMTLPRWEQMFVILMLYTGPVWLLLLHWARAPVAVPDAKLKAFRDTKFFDFLAALPLILWFAQSAMQMRPHLVRTGSALLGGTADLLTGLLFFSLLFSALFCLLSVWLLVIRDKPVLRSQGILPRLAALSGTFLGVAMLRLDVPQLPLAVQALAFFLTAFGSAASMLVLWRLGKSFSIMPEARKLVTGGPYAYARHPLYAAEIITVVGMSLQYQQPWAALMGGGVIALQVTRSLFEEKVLTQAFPEYEAYRARTKRFIPGVI